MDQTLKFKTAIRIQLVHIAGPRKGDIDEFNQERISIGRSPTAHVVYPASLRIVSRDHAEIVREGNRYWLKNISKNGCLVNGERMDNVILKQGDVITFAPGGPKVSFLYALDSSDRPTPQVTSATDIQGTQSVAMTQTVSAVKLTGGGSFTIQFGTDVRSFDLAGITLGRGEDCDFVIPHQRVADRHLYLYFADNECWAHDLTLQHLISINHKPVLHDTALVSGDVVTLTPKGPHFKYFGSGKLAEMNSRSTVDAVPLETSPPPPRRGGLGEFFKSLFRK